MSDEFVGVILQLAFVALWAIVVVMRAKSKRGQPTVATEPAAPVQVEPVASVQELQARRSGLAERASALLGSVRGEQAFAPLLRVYEAEVARELDRLRLALRERDAVGRTAEIGGQLARVDRRLAIYERIAAQRKGGRFGQTLTDADRLLLAMFAPLTAHGRAESHALRAEVPTTLFGDLPANVDTKLLLIGLAPEFGAHLLDWDGLLLHAAERLFHEQPGLAAESYQRLGLDGRALAGDGAGGYDVERVYACFGPWLPALFAEVATTLQLGEAHALAIAARYPPGTAVTVARGVGRFVHREPPPHVRMLTAIATLEELGQHRQALAVKQRWHAQHGELGSSYLPLPDRRFIEVETAAFTELMAPVLDALLHEPFDALGGARLQAVAGFAQGPHEHQAQRELAPRLARGEAVSAPPRQVLGAALTAWVELNEPDEAAAREAHDRLLRAFRRSLDRKSSREVAGRRSAPAGKPTVGSARRRRAAAGLGSALREDLRSGSAWAEAVVLQAAIGRRR